MLRRLLLLAVMLALLGFGAPQSSGAVQLSTGRIAYDHEGIGDRNQIYTITSTGGRRRTLTTSRHYSSYDPAYSPDGERIVFVRAYRHLQHDYKQWDLWTMHADGTHKARLTSTPGVFELQPAWSPDGKQIVFAVDGEGIWIIGVDGLGRRQLTTGDDSSPSWSPDGSTIAFARSGSIFVVPAAGGTPTSLGSDPAVTDFGPAWSPDGTKILFSSFRPDTLELDLWVMNADGSNRVRITNTPNLDELEPAWSPDGRRIVYSGAGESSSWQIYVSDANGAQRQVLTHACGACGGNGSPSWQPLP